MRGFPLKFCNGNGARKTRTYPYQDIKNCDNRPDIHSFRHSTGIGQTDRQPDGIGTTMCMHCVLKRDKKETSRKERHTKAVKNKLRL